jgi:hypothetical protein
MPFSAEDIAEKWSIMGFVMRGKAALIVKRRKVVTAITEAL